MAYVVGPVPHFPACNMKITMFLTPNIQNRCEVLGQCVLAEVEVVGLHIDRLFQCLL